MPNRFIPVERCLPTELICDYKPRPPDTQLPHITPHEFEMALMSCKEKCLLAGLHDCVGPPEGTLFIERIPNGKHGLTFEVIDLMAKTW